MNIPMPIPATEPPIRTHPACALVFGGTGAVGSAVLRALAQAGVRAAFTWHQSSAKAQALQAELAHCGHRAYQVDLADAHATRAILQQIHHDGFSANLFIHCAVHSQSLSLEQLSDADWATAQAVNCQSAFIALQTLAPAMMAAKEGHVVLLGALDRTQSAKLPLQFAASQGALSALAMAAAKELGPHGVRVNMIALGMLEQGISANIDPKLVADFQNFSALKRLGQPDEVARTILWLALENTYINGRVLAVNGGV